MTTFLDDEIGRVPGESVIPADWAPVQAANPAWTLTGDVWETVTTEETTTLEWVGDAPLTPRMEYVMTVEAQADADIALRWLVHQTYYDGGTLVLADGAANIDSATPVPAGAWVETARAWDAPDGVESGHFTTEVTAPIGTTVQIRAPFAAPLDGALVVRQVVAGNPEGARVVLAGDSLTAYDSTGTETARITGEGGEFVGGEFRTSDSLPGQVILSDTAADGSPGIGIAPVNVSGMMRLPYVAPDLGGVSIFGGESATGDSAEVYARPTYAGMYGSGADGSWSRVQATKHIAGLTRSGAGGDTGAIQVYPGFSVVECVWGGVTRTLSVGNSGFRMITVADGVTTTVNLGELADRVASLEARVAALEA